MSSINELVVREYFETLGFAVRQLRKHQVPARAKLPAREEADFLIVNPRVTDAKVPKAMLWGRKELGQVRKAVVGVRGWHTERFSPAVLRKSPEVFRFASKEAASGLRREAGSGGVAKILCLSNLPASKSLQDETLELCGQMGVNGVVIYPAMLMELIRHVDVNRNYEKSDLLQLLRILKTYDLLKDTQMELFRKRR